MTTTPFAISRFAPADKQRGFTLSADAWPQMNFAREMTDGIHIDDPLPPLEPTWKSWASGFGCVLFMVAVWAVL